MTTQTVDSKKENRVAKDAALLFCLIAGFVVLAGGAAALITYFALPAAINKQKSLSETNAVVTLKILGDAQKEIKTNDKDKNGKYDFTDLKTLGVTGSINPSLARGRRNGYLFETAAGTDDPEKTWWAKASPIEKTSPFRYFFLNHEGVCYASKTDFKVDLKTGAVPKGIEKLNVEELNARSKKKPKAPAKEK